MQKSQGYQLFLFINATVVFFTLACIIVASGITLFTVKMSSDIASSVINEPQSSSIYLHLLKSANQSFVDEKEIKQVSVSDMAFKFATSITPEDPRTFLGRELPSFSFFDTKIHIAGQGTDYTTLPIESSPPMEELLKDRETVQSESEEKEQTDNNNGSPVKPPDKKNVYIYHTHSWESYLPFIKNGTVPDDAVSNNEKVNVISVGNKLLQNLNSKGIGVEHNKTNMTAALHQDGLNANHSYPFVRDLVTEAMSANNDLDYLIDIHRDALRKDKTFIKINGKEYARVFFVVGSESKNFEKNLKLAEDLHNMLEEKYPGLSRGIGKKDYSKGNGIYNQDLSDRAILLEAGGVDNNRKELDNTMEAFSEVFSDYYWKQKDAQAE
ncbi:stage II sporulation protein P [Cytobacillus purgationiresistens]|uniref:Stage II sporulation protein P n=1 Tax=Cytobacillus purgationiresistens TaxID=863449 RepID=A0ABU0AMH2_9BACI|nr:stage II sporulation protein P [Cytobacillus purgationiresistens]MDQ0272074.1 stage II sporulation protein P [Cytobacillus purgationiresistens]